MTDNTGNNDVENIEDDSLNPNRRRMLMMGAVAASSVVTIRPAMAQSTASVTNCTIQIFGNQTGHRSILPDGSLVPHGTPGAFRPPARRYTRDEIFFALHGHDLPGSDYGASRAYVNYIKNLRSGEPGFTCYTSIITPR